VALHIAFVTCTPTADVGADFLQRGNRGHDLPRLVESSVALQVLTTVTRSPHGLNTRAMQPMRVTTSRCWRWCSAGHRRGLATERALYPGRAARGLRCPIAGWAA
jgi:hypothetical protein